MPQLVIGNLSDKANIRVASTLLSSYIPELSPSESYLLISQWLGDLVRSSSLLPAWIVQDRRELDVGGDRLAMVGMSKVMDSYEVCVAVALDDDRTVILRRFMLDNPDEYKEDA